MSNKYKDHRSQIVIEELGEQAVSDFEMKGEVNVDDFEMDCDCNKIDPVEKFIADAETMKNKFEDADPFYILQRLADLIECADGVGMLTNEMNGRRDYPKLSERLQFQRQSDIKRRLKKPDYDVQQFLKKFPDPQQQFENERKFKS